MFFPFCPTYFSGQSIHFICQITLLLYLYICGLSFNIFCIVLLVRKGIFTLVFRKSFVIPLTSFLLYVKATHFVFWCCKSVCVFCFCLFFFGGGGLIKFLSYFLLYSMFFMVFFSISYLYFIKFKILKLEKCKDFKIEIELKCE
jgi:hypothetical protein